MSVLKRILNYGISTLIAFLCAFIYMHIILGTQPKPSTNFMRMFDWVYEYTFVYIGTIIGIIIAFLFILIDFFYLNHKLKNRRYSTVIRLIIIILIAVFVMTTHYILEKVIDVI
ncbi:hypothetical protein [Psychroserpens luteus]|uniref:Uncharacterized protein n=1 Tax=Psychroserpens luteus TaxID=1434066 RepID=A0ABW5ZML0_9FLAO|nr:hypothetical protein [Psychroserpens luteus]